MINSVYRDAKMFLAGIEVPFEQASVTSSINSMPMCSFSLKATALGMFLRYRTPVHIFVYDGLRDDYMLLFEGELTALGLNSSHSSATISCTATGLFSYLTKMVLNWSTIGSAPGDWVARFSELQIGNEDVITVAEEGAEASLSNHLFELARTFGEAEKGIDVTAGLLKFIRQGFTAETKPNIIKEFYTRKGLAYNMIPGEGQGTGRYGFDRSAYLDKYFSVAKAGAIGKVLSSTLNQKVGVKTSRWEYIQRIANLVGYDIAMPSTNLENSFMFKPMLYFAAPPACNVLTSVDKVMFSYSRSMDQIPTRLCATSAVMDQAALANVNMWVPLSVQDGIRKDIEYFKNNKNRATKNIDGKNYPVGYETEEEIEYGVCQSYTAIQRDITTAISTMDEKIISSGDLAAFEKIRKAQSEYNSVDESLQYIGTFYRMAQDHFERLRLNPSRASFSSRLKPELVAGFPMSVITEISGSSDPIVINGYLTSVTHTINPKGFMGTNGQLMMCYNTADNHIDVPAVLHDVKDFYPNEIGKFYKKMLGCSTVEGTEQGKSSYEVAKGLSKKMMGQDEETRIKFAQELGYRNIPVLSKMGSFYKGMKIETDKPFAGNDKEIVKMSSKTFFNDKAREAVENYVSELKTDFAMTGFGS